MNIFAKITTSCLVAFFVVGCAEMNVNSDVEAIPSQGLNPKQIAQLFVHFDSGNSLLNGSKEQNFLIPLRKLLPKSEYKDFDVFDFVNHPLLAKYFSSKIRKKINEIKKLSDFASSNQFFHPAVHEFNVLRTWKLGKPDFSYDGGNISFDGSRKSSFSIVEFENGSDLTDRYAVEMNFLYTLKGTHWQLVDVEVHYIDYEYEFKLLSRELKARELRYLKYQELNMPTT